jgi:hypothetical protein
LFFILTLIFSSRGDISNGGITCPQDWVRMYINSASSASLLFVVKAQHTTPHHSMKLTASLILFSTLLAAITTVAQGNTSCPL